MYSTRAYCVFDTCLLYTPRWTVEPIVSDGHLGYKHPLPTSYFRHRYSPSQSGTPASAAQAHKSHYSTLQPSAQAIEASPCDSATILASQHCAGSNSFDCQLSSYLFLPALGKGLSRPRRGDSRHDTRGNKSRGFATAPVICGEAGTAGHPRC